MDLETYTETKPVVCTGCNGSGVNVRNAATMVYDDGLGPIKSKNPCSCCRGAGWIWVELELVKVDNDTKDGWGQIHDS